MSEKPQPSSIHLSIANVTSGPSLSRYAKEDARSGVLFGKRPDFLSTDHRILRLSAIWSAPQTQLALWLAPRAFVAVSHVVPVDDVEEVLDVFSATILVLQIVGMLPHVEDQKGDDTPLC